MSKKYELKYREEYPNEIIPCDCCGCEVPTAMFNEGCARRKEINLCQICAETGISNIAVHYKNQHDNSTIKLAKIIARTANILKDSKK